MSNVDWNNAVPQGELVTETISFRCSKELADDLRAIAKDKSLKISTLMNSLMKSAVAEVKAAKATGAKKRAS